MYTTLSMSDSLTSVLYIDDEASLLDIGKIFLERLGGFRVATAGSAHEALRILKETQYDVVVSDYQMPGMDGIGLLKRIREHSRIPFILFTGKGREEVVIEAINNGADFYLQKGGDPKSQFAELAHKIRQAVEKHRAEDSLRESEQRLSDLINFLPDPTLAIDREGRVIVWNREIEELTGIRAVDILGKGNYEYSLPFYGERRPILIDLCLESEEEVRKYDYTILTQDGKTLIAETTLPKIRGEPRTMRGKASPLYDNHGRIVGAIETIIDITQMKNVEEALRQSEERFRYLISNIADFIWETDESARFTFVSPQVKDILGYTQGELIGHTPFEFIDPDSVQPNKQAFQRAAARKEVALIHHTRWLHKDGHVVILESHATPSHRNDGSFSGYHGIDRDVTGWILAENNLQESEIKFSSFVREASEGFVVVDETGTVIEWNGAQERLTGISRHQALGKAFVDLQIQLLVPGRNTQERIDRLRNDIAGMIWEGSPDHFFRPMEIEILRPDGETRIIRQTIFPIRITHGFRIGSISLDITEQKRVENALRHSEEKFRTLVESSFEGTAIHQDQRIVFLNQAAVRILGGTTPAQFIGKQLSDFLDQDFRERVIQRAANAVGSVQPVLHEKFIRLDGLPVEVEVGATPCIWEGAAAVHVVFREHPRFEPSATFPNVPETGADLTGGTCETRSLVKVEELYRSLLESVPDGICITDPLGTITYASPRALQLFGVSSPFDAAGSSIFTWIAPESSELAIQNFRSVMQKRSAPTAIYRVERNNGSLFFIEINSSVLTDQSGSPVGMLAVLRDVTDRQSSQESLVRANEKLSLLSSITRHDILNKISVLRGYLDLAREMSANKTMQDFIGRIDDVAQIICHMLEFTKDYEEIGIKSPAWQEIRTSVISAAQNLDLHGLTLTVPEEQVEICADPLLQRVFYNLLDNTVRHAPGATSAEISWHRSPAGITIVYEDNGQGIAAEEKDLIFHRGYGSHTGLGLFLTREILSITGISICETGEAGKGARFEILVPERFVRISEGSCTNNAI